MRLIIRLVIALAVLWVGLLVSGYGLLIGSHENAAGLGIKCNYLTARHITSAQYLHLDNNFLGVTSCPLLRKTDEVIDTGR
jgi:hypothetical protein